MSFDGLLKDRELPVRSTGYDREAVDDLLRATEEALAALVAERDELRARLASAEGELDRTQSDMRDIQGALLAAVKIKAEAERTSELIVAGARHQARKLLSEARETARRSEPDAADPLDGARVLEDVFQRVLASPASGLAFETSQ